MPAKLMLAPDTVLQSRYRIIRKLSAGGMGTVYEAIDLRFNSQVALKETHFTEEALRKQFEREAHLLYKLRHPAIARVIDHFIENDGQFLVMDYIEGEDLWQKLEQHGAFPVAEVLTWADQLLDALHYLHSQDPPIIHRDIKPQNLKLTVRGQIILLDFGLAKGFAGEVSRVTTSGSIFGYTPNYAALEQIQGEGTNSQSDLYSLAATLYHLMTGAVPPDALKRISAVADADADPLLSASEINPEISTDVSDALKRGMAISRKQRFATAMEMRDALNATSRSTGVAVHQTQPEKLPSTLIVPAITQAVQEDKAQELLPTVARPHLPTREEQSATVAGDTVAATVNLPGPTVAAVPSSRQNVASVPAIQPAPRSKRRAWIIIGGVVGMLLIALLLLFYGSRLWGKRRAPVAENTAPTVTNMVGAELVFSRPDFKSFARPDPADNGNSLTSLSVKYLETLKSIDGVAAATPVLRYFSIISVKLRIDYHGQVTDGPPILRTIDGVDWPTYSALMSTNILLGRGLSPTDSNVVLISQEIANSDKLGIGDKINLFDSRTFTIVGVFAPDNGAPVKMPLSELQGQLAAPEKCTLILIKCKNAGETDQVAKRIAEALPGNKVQSADVLSGK